MTFRTSRLNQGATIYRAAPTIGLQRGNGTATSTKHNFAWFSTSREGAEPYEIIQPHLNNAIISSIREYTTLQPLTFLNLNNAKTIEILNQNMTKSKLGNMKQSFKIDSGKVKRVSEKNQFNRNKNTANRLRTFLLLHHPQISGWRHGKMERPGGGYQLEEVVVFTPAKSVIGKAAQGSGVPSPLRPVPNSRQPLIPIPSSLHAGSSPRSAPAPSPVRPPAGISKRKPRTSKRGLF